MAISLVQHHSATGTTSAAITISTPTAGNLLVVGICSLGNGNTPATPSGYTAIGSVVSAGTAGIMNLRLFYRIADGTEGTSLTVSESGSGSAVDGFFFEYHSTNGSFSSPLDQNASNSMVGNGTQTTLGSGTITPTVANFVAVVLADGAFASETNPMAMSNSFVVEETQRGNRGGMGDLIVSGGSGSYSSTTTWSPTALASNNGACAAIANFAEPGASTVVVRPKIIVSREAQRRAAAW